MNAEIDERRRGLVVGSCVGMFCDHADLAARQRSGKPAHARPRRTSSTLDKLVELETLQREVYTSWGVKLELEGRKDERRCEVYDELAELVPQGLTEQRERLLDLIDRVVGAMVEESCPREQAAGGLGLEGHRQRLQGALRARAARRERRRARRRRAMLARDLFERAEEIYLEAREGDRRRAPAAHLPPLLSRRRSTRRGSSTSPNMEHLRDGIGLRGYGQRDPKKEYKKEGYDLFVNMMANVASTRPHQADGGSSPEGRRDIEALEAEADERHHAELEQAVARHPGEDGRRWRRWRRGQRIAAGARARARAPGRSARPRRSAATTPARAARARSSRSATARSSRTSRPPRKTRRLHVKAPANRPSRQ